MVHIPLMFLSELCEFPSASCFAQKEKFVAASASMMLKSSASPDMLPFSLCNKNRLAIRHINRTLFTNTISTRFFDIGN
jgi:hypothetical protein